MTPQATAARPSSTDELGYLFVMTYGRSGSTLLMGLLNTLPGYLIRGENGDALRHLHAYSRTLQAEKQRRRPRAASPTHPFFGIDAVPEAKLARLTRRLAVQTVLRPEPETRVTGFKEIRWWREGLDDYVAWLREVFPGARFVVNTRDHDAVLASGWWARGDRARNAAHLAEVEQRLLSVADELGDAAFRVHFDDYTADPSALRGLIDWLGEAYDEEKLRETLAVRHSVAAPAAGHWEGP